MKKITKYLVLGVIGLTTMLGCNEEHTTKERKPRERDKQKQARNRNYNRNLNNPNENMLKDIYNSANKMNNNAPDDNSKKSIENRDTQYRALEQLAEETVFGLNVNINELEGLVNVYKLSYSAGISEDAGEKKRTKKKTYGERFRNNRRHLCWNYPGNKDKRKIYYT